MSKLQDGLALVNERKAAALGDPEEGSLVQSPGVHADRAMLIGTDIEYEELSAVAISVAAFFCQHSLNDNPGLLQLFAAAWTDGYLHGLLTAPLPPSPPTESEVTEDADSEGV